MSGPGEIGSTLGKMVHSPPTRIQTRPTVVHSPPPTRPPESGVIGSNPGIDNPAFTDGDPLATQPSQSSADSVQDNNGKDKLGGGGDQLDSSVTVSPQQTRALCLKRME